MYNVNAEEVAGEVIMLRTNWSGPVLLVEGPNDVRFFEAMYDNNRLRVIPAFGWENVRDAKCILDNKNISKIVCVIDLDYRSVLKQLPEDVDTFTTDSHDLEIMIMDSPALPKVLTEYGSREKTERWPDGLGGVRKHAYGVASNIAALRFYSQKNGLGLCFEAINYPKFVDKHNISFKAKAFVNHLRGKWPPNKEITLEILEKAVVETSEVLEFSDHSILCCGHDVTEIIAIGLRSAWGTNPAKTFTGAQVESLLRLAYSRKDFSATILAQKIETWFERQNGAT